MDLVLRRRRDRSRDQRRLRLHHPVLHRRHVPAGARDRGGHRKTGPATNIISGTAVGFETTAVTAITISIALFASYLAGRAGAGLDRRGRRQRRRHLRHRRRHDGHADDDGLHPRHGHLRADHRQRRRHRPVQPCRRERPRDHRPPRRGRQHHQGADQGLRHRVGLAGGLPALQRLHRQGQPDPAAPDRRRAPARPARCSSRSTSPT